MGSAHVIIKNKWRRACASATIYGPVNIKAMISRLSQSRGAARSARSEGRHKQRESNTQEKQPQAPGQAPRPTVTEFSNQNGTPPIPFSVPFSKISGAARV